MPLQDHFHPPLSQRRHWHAFHNAWATYIASALNQQLPEGYFAEPNVQFNIEIDVGTFEERRPGEPSLSRTDDGRAAVPSAALPGWTPPAPVLTIPLPLAGDIVEVEVFNSEAGPTLVGAIELVSPANKDRADSRAAFVSKCAAYVQQGIGLAVVDVVTDRHANLHTALLARLGTPDSAPLQTDLYAVSYQPMGRNGQATLAVWQEALAVGRPLPTLPLWLRGGPYLRLDLEATYERTCQEQRVYGNGR